MIAVIKRLIIYNFISTVLGTLIYLVHNYILSVNNVDLAYSLELVYIFFQAFFLGMSIFIELVNKINNLNIGYFFMATIVVKIFVFGLLFKDVLFSESVVSTISRLSLVIPMLLYVTFEAFYSIKIVNPIGKSDRVDL